MMSVTEEYSPILGAKFGLSKRPQQLRGNAFSPAKSDKNIEGFFLGRIKNVQA